MNIDTLIDISTNLKSLKLNNINEEQQKELLEIVNILDTSALVLDEITFLFNNLIEDENLMPNDNEILLGAKPNKKVNALLEHPTFDELSESLKLLKSKAVNGSAKILDQALQKLELSKISALKALAFLQKLDYVFDETPKIILIN